MSLKAPDSMHRAASGLVRETRRPRPVRAVLEDLDRALRDGEIAASHSVPTGFEALDRVISGGLGRGELVLIGGAQGVGKTTMALQIARNLAADGARVLYVCYEHNERYLLNRLLTMESHWAASKDIDEGIRLRAVDAAIEETSRDPSASLSALIERTPALGLAEQRVARYADRLLLLRGSAAYTDLASVAAELVALRDAHPDTPLILFVDYLQKMPVFPDTLPEVERVTRVVEGLKDLALSLTIPVVAIVAADSEGIKAPRLRLHHLRGGSAILYEADVIAILNEKHRIVTKNSLTFNPHLAEAFHLWIVCSIEKNRGGRQLVDLEFRKRFEFACFEPDGRPVAEMLIDERIQPD